MRRCKKMITDQIRLTFVRKHEICASGCYLFDPEIDANLIACPLCNRSRNVNKKAYIKMVSLEDKISQMLVCDDVRESMEYRFNMFENDSDSEAFEGEYTDMFSGQNYKDLREQGLGRNKHDVFIVLNVDGFSSKFSQTAMVLINAVIMNLPPTERYKNYIHLKLSYGLCAIYYRLTNNNVIPLAVLYGNRKKDLRSFLKPFIKELAIFGRTPLRVFKNGVLVATSNIFCLAASSDLIETSKLMDHTGKYK